PPERSRRPRRLRRGAGCGHQPPARPGPGRPRPRVSGRARRQRGRERGTPAATRPMTRYLTVQEVLDIHAEVIRLHGGSDVTLDLRLVDSAVAQPQATFGGHELLPTLPEKAAALGFSLSKNHGF